MTVFEDAAPTSAARQIVHVNPTVGGAMKARLQRMLDHALDNPEPIAAAEFIGVLGEAINTIDDDGYGGIPYSIGMRWLHQNVETFALMWRKQTDPDPVWFFRRLIDVGNSYLFSLLHNSQLLQLIGEQHREQFIRELFMAFPPESSDWVKSVLEVGISRETIAQMILQRLRDTQINTRYNSPNFVTDFMSYGAGRIDSGFRRYRDDGRSTYRFVEAETTWSMLTDDQLTEALRICEQKIPGILFRSGREDSIVKMEARFMAALDDDEFEAGKQRTINLLTEAAASLTPTALRNAPLEALDMLPLAERRKLLIRMEGGSISFLVHVASQLEENDGRKLFDAYIALLTLNQGVSAELYGWLLPRLDAMPSQSLADHIKNTIIANLRWAGYQFGTIQEGTVPSGRRRGCVQYQVTIGDKIYIQEENYYRTDRYYPRQGDHVIFHAKSGRHLTPRVIIVTFTLVSRPATK